MKMGEKVVSKRDANYCCTFVNYFIAKFNTLPVFLYFISRSMFAKLNEMKIKSRIDQCNCIRVRLHSFPSSGSHSTMITAMMNALEYRSHSHTQTQTHARRLWNAKRFVLSFIVFECTGNKCRQLYIQQLYILDVCIAAQPNVRLLSNSVMVCENRFFFWIWLQRFLSHL